MIPADPVHAEPTNLDERIGLIATMDSGSICQTRPYYGLVDWICRQSIFGVSELAP